LRFLSESIHGTSVDEFLDVHPDILEQYHGVIGNPIHRGTHQTGAGYTSDEEYDESVGTTSDTDATESNSASDGDDTEDDHAALHQSISSHIIANTNHKPVKVPRSQTPFPSRVHEALFDSALTDIQTAGLIPAGYHLRPSEWGVEGYPTSEQVAYQKRKEITIHLPHSIWLQRAVTWCQALHTMQTLQYTLHE
jgi:hypothetical protein